MLDRTEQERWRQAAADARRGAAVQGEAALHNWACFLAEQAGQLAVEGLLHGTGAGAWGHDLVALGDAVREVTAMALAPDVDAALRRLSRHYIPPRYPDAHPGSTPLAHYSADDVREALSDADRVLVWIDGLWSALLEAEDEGSGGGDARDA